MIENAVIVSLETAEGTYQLGCLIPSPHNTSPQHPVGATKYAGHKSRQLPATLKPYVVSALVAITSADYDDEGNEIVGLEIEMYQAICLPLQGSAAEADGAGLIVDLPPPQVKRVYRSVSIDEAAREIREVLAPPEPEPEPISMAMLAPPAPMQPAGDMPHGEDPGTAASAQV